MAKKAEAAVEETKKSSKVSRGVAAKAESEVGLKQRKYPDNYKIKILNKENPHRAGKDATTGRYAAFEALKGCKTMGDYYATGHKVKYIASWIESGHLQDFAEG